MRRPLTSPLRKPGRRDLLVLCYHAVSSSWPASLSISPDQLGEQLESLIGRGYRGETFSAALAQPPTGRTVVVTFDDAYLSTLTAGKPVLDRLGLPATVFVPTAFPATGQPMSWPGIDVWTGGEHAHELLPLSWMQLRALADDGWEVGSHTVTHPRLTQIDDHALRGELVQSREACVEALGRQCTSLAYPYGDVDGRVVRATEEAGYTAAGALPARLYRPRSLAWPRIGVYPADRPSRFRIKVSPATRWARATLGI